MPARWEPLDLLRLEPHSFVEGEYWRLFSYQFLHAGTAPFFVNLLVLWSAGRETEPTVGPGQSPWLCLPPNAAARLAMPRVGRRVAGGA